MELIFNYLFSIIEQFGQDGYKILLVIYFLLMYKYWKIFIKEKILLSTIIFILYGFILAFFCIDRNRAFGEILCYIFGWTLPFFLGYTTPNKYSREKILLSTMIVFSLFIVVGLFSYFGLLPEKFLGIRFTDDKQLRICTFRVVFAAKATLMFILSFTMILFLKNKTKFLKWSLYLCSLLFFIAILLSGSRIYYGVTILVSSSLLLFYAYKTKYIKPLIYFLIVCIISFVFIYSFNNSIKKRIDNIGIKKDISITTRFNMHKYAIDSFKKHPIFGVGPSQATIQEEFKKVKTDRAEQWHLHSIYFDTLADFGIIGLILFFVIIFLIIKNLFITYTQFNSILVLSMIFAWGAILIGDVFDTVLADPFLASLYFWFTGLALSKQKNQIK